MLFETRWIILQSRTQRTHAETNTFTPKWKQKISYFALPVDELLFKSLV